MKKTIIILSAFSMIFTMLVYGMDREVARQDYIKAVENQDFDRPITGCLFDTNCKHYTNLLDEE